MSRSKRFLLRLFLVIAAPLLFITALEWLCHVAGWGHPTRFLLPAKHEGQAVWIDNQLFGYRFFDPAVSRAPSPIVVPVNKPTNEFRVVVLGESAAMGEPEPAYGPARMLEQLLSASHPDKQVRVINAAMTAINSHVIVEIARDLERLQPDVVILYIGNNEVVGPYGPGTVFHRYFASPRLNRFRSVLTRFRITSAIRSLMFSMRGGDKTVWQGMEMFTRNRVEQTDPRLEQVRTSLHQNVTAIIKIANSLKAQAVINTIAVNLVDQAPLDGSPFVKDTNLDSLKQQRDADRLRFRADRMINETLREIAGDHPAVELVDIEQLFEQNGKPGYDLFIDHVHFNFTGSYRLAEEWANVLNEHFPATTTNRLSLDEMKQRLVWNPYNALDIAETMIERASRPPFSSTFDRKERMLYWTRERARLLQDIARLPLHEVMKAYESAMARDPDDIHFPQQAIRALMREDRFQDAGSRLDHLHHMLPHRADVRGWLAIRAALEGRSEQVWDIMTRDAPDLGQIPADILVGASETLLQAGYREESLALIEVAASHYPNRIRLQTLLASRLAQAGKSLEAANRFETLENKYPDDVGIKEEYGILLAMSGHPVEAESRLSHLQNAHDPESRLKWIQFLLFQHRTTEAERALRDLLQEFPGHGTAMSQLAQISMQKKDVSAAIGWMEQWVAAEPWQGDAWGTLGDWYDGANRTHDAVIAYDNAIPILADPNSTKRALAWLLATEDDPKIRNPQRSLQLISEVVSSNQLPDGFTRLVHASALAANRSYEDAVIEIDRALEETTEPIEPALLEQLQQARQLFKRGESIRQQP